MEEVPNKISGAMEEEEEQEDYETSLDQTMALLCWLVSFSIYLGTLYPHVPGGDSGELIASAYQLGVGHPPGYPLMMILCKIGASILTFGNVAWRMNLTMALIGSTAPAFLYLTAFHVVHSRPAAVLAAGLFAINPIVWNYSTHAEVFPLNNALTALLLYLTVRFFDTLDVTIARYGALVMGLGLTNQHTIIIFEVPLALGVLVVGRNQLFFRPLQLLILFLVFCVGFSVYLYLPLTTLSQPYVSWGDGTTWTGFCRHILRMEYGSFRLSADEKEPGRLYEGLEHWFKNLLQQHPYGIPYIGIVGVIAALALPFRTPEKRFPQRGIHAWLFGAYLFYLIFFHSLANLPLWGRPDNCAIIERFWMQPATIEVIWMAYGAAEAAKLIPANVRTYAVSGIVGSVLIFWLQKHWDRMDQSSNYVVEQFGREVLNLMPPSALFLTMTDLTTNSLRYLQVCHHHRQDVLVADQNLMSAEWFVDGQNKNFPGVAFPARLYWPSRPDGWTMRMMVDNNFGKFRVFTFAGSKEKSYEEAGYKMIPFGYAEEFARPMDYNNLNPWQLNESMWAETVHMHLPKTPPFVNISLAKYPEGTWEYKALDEYYIAVNRYGLHAFHLMNEWPRSALPACIYTFEQATRDLPNYKCNCSFDYYTVWYKNLGTCYYQSIGKEIGNLQRHRRLLKDSWGEYLRRVDAGYIYIDSGVQQDQTSMARILDMPPFKYDPALDHLEQGEVYVEVEQPLDIDPEDEDRVYSEEEMLEYHRRMQEEQPDDDLPPGFH